MINDEEWEKIKNNGAFCPALYDALYIDPSGVISPCCTFEEHNRRKKVDIQNKKPILDAFNDPVIQQVRSDSVKGIRNISCNHCWRSEKLGRYSYRQNFIDRMVVRKNEDTIRNLINEDNVIKELNLSYLDARMDNICNLKCRSCGVSYSHTWNSESKQLYNRDVGILKSPYSVEEITPHLSNIKKIYFAGGEPLISEDHYKILDFLIEKGKTDTEIYYNTNFSKLTWSKYDVIKYWNQFSNVVVGASLDGNYARGEYLRKNLKWSTVIENRERMIKEAPNTKFTISATCGMQNAYNLLDFHREWYEKGYLHLFDFVVYPLSHPESMCIKNLPLNHKGKLIDLYTKHIEWISPVSDPGWESYKELCIQGFKSVINCLNEDADPNWPEHLKREWILDTIRNENFFEIFPEYLDLKDIISYNPKQFINIQSI
jgi:MoaA/NifB/PqqE/SkfB family radical SAM enzyme